MKRWTHIALALPLAGTLAAGGAILWAKGPRGGVRPVPVRALPGAEAAPARAPERLTVVTFNIAFGGGPEADTGEPRTRAEVESYLASIAARIREAGADVALLQEVDLAARRSHEIDEAAWLAAATGLRHVAYAVTWSKRFVPFPYWPPRRWYGPTVSGQAVLSRFPIREQQVVALPQPEANPFWYNWFYLQRMVQRVSIDLGEGVLLTVVNLHLEAFDRPNRELQARLVADLLRQASGPLLVAGGDLNTVPPEAPLRKAFPDEPETDMDGESTIPTLRAAHPGLVDVHPSAAYAGPEPPLTFPSARPNRKLDYLFHDQAGLACESARVLDAGPPCSDHLPVAAVLRLR